MWAAGKGHIDVVKLLLDKGADINAENKNGVNALAHAVTGRKIEVVRLLLDRGATVNPRTARNESRRHKNSAIAKLLNQQLPAASRPRTSYRPAARTIHSDIDEPGYRMSERPDDFAVVIGIDGYKNLPAAQFGERDAQTMRDHLVAMGYPKRHVILLKGDAATGNGMRKYLEEWLPRNVKPDSTVFFYYSGHGAPDVESGKAFLVPWDGDASFLKSTAYPVEKLYASLNRLKARRIIVALDACFSGAGGRSVLAKGARPLVTTVDEGFSRRGKIALFTAASGSEITTTIADEGHGIFTYYFIKGLQGAAKDASGRVTAKGLFQYLMPKVQDEARLQNREQTPSLHTSYDLLIRPR